MKILEKFSSPRHWATGPDSAPAAMSAGRARHSVRAVVVNQNRPVCRRRRAEDCPPYQRAGGQNEIDRNGKT